MEQVQANAPEIAKSHRLRSWVRRCLGLMLVASLVTIAWFWWYFSSNLDKANIALSRGHNVVATKHLENCRWVRPEQRDVLLLAARVARRSGSWEEAEQLLDRYWQRHGDDDRLAMERLMLRATRGEIESAGPLLAQHVRENGPDARAAREAMAVGLVFRFRWAEAELALADWLATSPDDTLALLLRGKLHEQRFRTSEALLDYRRCLELDPEFDEPRLRLTTLLLQLRQGAETLEHLEYLRHRLPDHAEVHSQIGKALALQGRNEEAKAAFLDCVNRWPDHATALAELARMASVDGDDQTAANYFAHVMRVDPGNLSSRHLYVLTLNRLGNSAEAKNQQELLKRLEDDGERVQKLIQGPLQQSPNDPSIHREIGLIALRSGRFDEALRWFRSALQVDPDHVPTHQVLAAYYRETGNPVMAARHRALAQQGGSKQ